MSELGGMAPVEVLLVFDVCGRDTLSLSHASIHY